MAFKAKSISASLSGNLLLRWRQCRSSVQESSNAFLATCLHSRSFGFRNHSTRDSTPFVPKKVLVVNKVTRLDYESRLAYRRPWRELSATERSALRHHMMVHGFDIAEILSAHREHSASMEQIATALAARSIDFLAVSPIVRMPSTWEDFLSFTPSAAPTTSDGEEMQLLRCDTVTPWWPQREVAMEIQPRWQDDDEDSAEWGEVRAIERAFAISAHGTALGGGVVGDGGAAAIDDDVEFERLVRGSDLLITVGGHDVFLASALYNDGSVPVIGVNACPSTASGRLCGGSSHEMSVLLDRMACGNYSWVKRHRIRVALRPAGSDETGQTLMQSALSEVFVGERDPCRSSILRVSRDGRNWDQVKCSGLLVSTATGAASWAAAAAALHPWDVMAVLGALQRLHGRHPRLCDMVQDGLDAGRVATEASARLLGEGLRAGSDAMHILAREPLGRPGADRRSQLFQAISGDPHPAVSAAIPGGTTLTVVALTSQQSEAHLVLDGRVHVPLERGTEALLQTSDERALWTVT